MMKSKKTKIILSILILIIFILFHITSFSDILKDDINNIAKIEIRNPGNGKLYSTTDKELINMFITTMNSPKYLKTVDFNIPLSGTSPLFLYNAENASIAKIEYKLMFVEVNDKNYMTIGEDEEKLKTFFTELYSDINIIE